MFESLSDEKLVDAYKKAIELKLNDEFIYLLHQAILERGIE
ncbi:sporulation histidine kinase inhibitor Sda [Radiobacillus deserti]|uniref:Sporulation histidine kinase inhibitor Sda n=1 Tax=Radiobacillus deserti TaxID=2594883 RepID=A0A516KD71_9BACI|nr:sporulation histidine kinase inhibitor Sda [Radiobacillus deserti]QDP39320.1 sporulation histidine kinase inhibitor Sda [Radiobacillus deserti]